MQRWGRDKESAEKKTNTFSICCSISSSSSLSFSLFLFPFRFLHSLFNCWWYSVDIIRHTFRPSLWNRLLVLAVFLSVLSLHSFFSFVFFWIRIFWWRAWHSPQVPYAMEVSRMNSPERHLNISRYSHWSSEFLRRSTSLLELYCQFLALYIAFNHNIWWILTHLTCQYDAWINVTLLFLVFVMVFLSSPHFINNSLNIIPDQKVFEGAAFLVVGILLYLILRESLSHLSSPLTSKAFQVRRYSREEAREWENRVKMDMKQWGRDKRGRIV